MDVRGRKKGKGAPANKSAVRGRRQSDICVVLVKAELDWELHCNITWVNNCSRRTPQCQCQHGNFGYDRSAGDCMRPRTKAVCFFFKLLESTTKRPNSEHWCMFVVRCRPTATLWQGSRETWIIKKAFELQQGLHLRLKSGKQHANLSLFVLVGLCFWRKKTFFLIISKVFFFDLHFPGGLNVLWQHSNQLWRSPKLHYWDCSKIRLFFVLCFFFLSFSFT